jgi:hypothetical protein
LQGIEGSRLHLVAFALIGHLRHAHSGHYRISTGSFFVFKLVTPYLSLIQDELLPFRYIVVFRLLDFFFMFFGVQHPIFDFIARAGVFGCGTTLPALETAFCEFVTV